MISALAASIFWSVTPTTAFAKPKVLVTAFEPFQGASTNRSRNVAETIRDRLESDVDVEVCILPVEYDRGAEVAKKCYEQMNPKPAMVMSLGERGCEKVQLETAAHNLDALAGLPDNAGDIRSNKVIDPKGPKSVGFDSHVAEMYCSASSFVRGQVVVSSTPGGYVCNNTAYHLARYFETQKVPYSFIHVPLNSCKGLGLSYESGRIISDMIRSAPPVGLSKKASSSTLHKICPQLPFKVEEIDKITKLLNQSPDPDEVRSCHKELFNRLRNRIAP